MARLFISQQRLDTWSAEERVRVEGDTMTLIRDGRAFRIVPAVRFLAVSGGQADTHDLVGRVRPEAELADLGADHYMESVIIEDTAYEVQCGFLGDPIPVESGAE